MTITKRTYRKMNWRWLGKDYVYKQLRLKCCVLRVNKRFKVLTFAKLKTPTGFSFCLMSWFFFIKHFSWQQSLDSLDDMLPFAPSTVKIPRPTLETRSPSRKKLEEDQLKTTMTSVKSTNYKSFSSTEKKTWKFLFVKN